MAPYHLLSFHTLRHKKRVREGASPMTQILSVLVGCLHDRIIITYFSKASK